YTNNASVGQTLVEHWNGSSWSVISSPDVGTSSNSLNDVAVASGNDVWAVGYYADNSVHKTLIEHWDGNAWSVIPSPNMGTSNNYLHGVQAAASNDVWA